MLPGLLAKILMYQGKNINIIDLKYNSLDYNKIPLNAYSSLSTVSEEVW